MRQRISDPTKLRTSMVLARLVVADLEVQVQLRSRIAEQADASQYLALLNYLSLTYVGLLQVYIPRPDAPPMIHRHDEAGVRLEPHSRHTPAGCS